VFVALWLTEHATRHMRGYSPPAPDTM
jgi:hypothetical protein